MLDTECFFLRGELATTVSAGKVWDVMYTPLENLKGKTSQECVNYLIKKWERARGLL